MKTMITYLFHRRYFLLLWLGLLGLASHARGQVLINWSNEVDSLLFDSGATALDASYSYKLGVFDTTGGWTPSLANVEEWVGRWTEMDSATFTPATGVFAGSFVLNDNNTFAQGQQAYMWIYDSLGAPGPNEWLLLTDDGNDGDNTDDWVIPLAQAYDPNCNCGTPTQDWVALNTFGANTPVVGGLSNVQGPGDYTATPPDFDFQTASVIVPEPASLFLPASVLIASLLRRKRTA
jgi:hypothetical protein